MVISLHIILYGAPYNSAAFTLCVYCPLYKMIFFCAAGPQEITRANIIISRYFSFQTLYFESPHKIKSAAERQTIREYGAPYSLYGPPYKNCKNLDFSPYKSSINRFHTQKTKNSKPY